MQKPGQLFHGWLTALNVIGGQELAATAAELNEPPALVVPSKASITAHGAGATVGAGAGSKITTPSLGAIAEFAVRPGPPGAPVSSTIGPPPPPTRVNVNFGQTFSVESKVLVLIVIDPVEALYDDRPTVMFHCCGAVPL